MLRLIASSFTIRGVNMVIKMLQMAPEHPLRSPQCIEHPGRLAKGVGAWGPEQVAVPWEPPQARTCHSLPSHKPLSSEGTLLKGDSGVPQQAVRSPPRKIPPFREDWPLLESACKTCQPIWLLCFQMLQTHQPFPPASQARHVVPPGPWGQSSELDWVFTLSFVKGKTIA